MARPRALIDTALLADAFAPDGLHGTSSSALARALGVAKPTLYAHGESKEALFLRAVEAEVERVLDRLQAAEAATAGRSAREGMTAAAAALLAYAAARPLGARLLGSTARHEASGVGDAAAAALRRPPDRLATALRRNLAEDGLDPALAPFLARAVFGAAMALAEVRRAEQRPSRLALAEIAAAVIPAPPVRAPASWPAA